MAYRFKLAEPISKGVRRVAREQFQRIAHEFEAAEVNPPGVHESRKAIKRLRALLRFVRPAIAEKTYKARNSGVRDIAQRLSGARDRTILFETIAKLETHFGDDGKTRLAPLRRHLGAAEVSRPAVLDPKTADIVRDLVAKQARLFDELNVKRRGFALLTGGLEQSYRHGRRALGKAYKSPTDESVHDLRKAVQWHWRQMMLISRAWPEYYEIRIAAARELSQLLGDDHDLAVLKDYVKANRKSLEGAARPVIRLARARQEELRAAAQFRAHRIFAEPAPQFIARMRSYWVAARHISLHEESVESELPAQDAVPLPSGQSSAPRLAIKANDDRPSQRRA